jgi:hypothetical protein
MPGPGCAWSEALVPRSRYVRGKPSSSAAAGPVVVDRSRPVGRLIYERLRAICSAGEVRSSRAAPCHRGAPAPPRSSVRSCAAPRTLVAMCSPPDYLGAPDPFAVLHAAAQLAQRMRLRTYVLNVGFWNPALLPRASATTDQLSGGRLELGLGAGHMRSEHEDAGVSWPRHRARVDQMERTLMEVRQRA